MKREFLTDTETFHLEIPADENNLSEVRDFIADICLSAGFSKREMNNTKLAIDEACTNIIKHAYRDTSGEIRIDVQAEPGKVEVNIFDRGTPFDWGQIKDPDLQEYVEIGKKGGLGIYLMNRLMDDLSYHSSDAGNRLYMAKSMAGVARTRRGFLPRVKPKWTSTLRFKFGLRGGLGLLGLVIFLWVIQFMNQTRDIESQRNQAWVDMRNLARSIGLESRDALVNNDIYDPKYRKITEYIIERSGTVPSMIYARIINDEHTIVSSSNIEEFSESYDVPVALEDLSRSGEWRTIRNQEYETIREYHYPILLVAGGESQAVELGRVILGVSEKILNEGINDPRPKTGFILIGIFIVGVSLIYLLISILVKPIQALTDGVRAIGEGDFDDEIKVEGPKEIGEIARAFNEMTGKFREAQKNVVEQERMQKEMQVAQEIQHSLLPKNKPNVSGYDIASLYRAAKEVGGDYYDFVKVNEETMGVVVADVSGKGVPGSLVMTMIRTALRMEARDNLSAAEVMARMNDFVTEDMKKGMFVTIFYVILDSKNRIISYASAGHNPMILFRAETDETFFLNPRGFPVGISLPDDTLFRRSIDVEKIKLKKDDMLVIYTDGVTEAMNVDREQYGEERLIQLIKQHGRLSPQEFIDKLTADVQEFTGDYPQNDDITLVSIKEKLMADDVLLGIRKKLLDLVEVGGLSVAEACQRMRVSPSTYYRYRRRLIELGERGLKNKELRETHEIKRVSLEQRKEILRIIRETPHFGAKRIADTFNVGKKKKDCVNESLVYDELKRMRLNTYERRLDYLRRNRFITEDEYQLLAASPAASRMLKQKPVVEPESAQASGAEPVPGEEPAVEPAEVEEQLARAMEFQPEVLPNVEIESEEVEGGIVVLKAKGHLDSSSAGELEEFLESVYEYGYRKIVVDLSEISYISSGGWGIFTGRVKTLREGEGDVVLAGMSSEVYDIYELLGFQDIIMHFQTIDESVAFLSLPFEERQIRLETLTSARRKAEEKEIEYREPVEVLEGEDEEEAWTPLRIEAGTVGASGEITVLYLDGVIDTVSCLKLRSIMDDLINKGSTKFVIDMSKVEYVSSAGWGVFAARINDTRQQDGDIKIFGMDPEVDGIFRLLGFDDIMRSFSILAEAIENFDKLVAPRGTPVEIDLEAVPREAEIPIQVETPDYTFGCDVSKARKNGRESTILNISGTIDASTVEALENRIESLVDETPRFLIVDLSKVVYISSAGWGVIVKYMQRLNEVSGKMLISGMNQAIYSIFRDLGFEPLIPHFISTKKALNELSVFDGEEYAENVKMANIAPRDAEKEEGIAAPDAAPAALLAGEAGGDQEEAVLETAADPVKEGVESVSEGEEIDDTMPRVGRADIPPLEDVNPEKADDSAVVIDVSKKEDTGEVKDGEIRKLGWVEYGKKLMKRNKPFRKDKKKK